MLKLHLTRCQHFERKKKCRREENKTKEDKNTWLPAKCKALTSNSQQEEIKNSSVFEQRWIWINLTIKEVKECI